MNTRELVSSAQRANLDVVFGFAGTMIDGVGKLAELNTRFTRSTLKDAFEMARNAAGKPQDWLAIQGSLAAPMAEKIQAYSDELLGIVSSTQAEILRAAQAEGAAYVSRFQTLVEDATKNAPAGSNAAIAALNSAVIAANTLYRTIGKTEEPADEAARGNFDVAAAAASKSAKRAVEQEQQAAKR
ncbi:Phasin (PHA-granule associated protein) [Burkholderia multivorans]